MSAGATVTQGEQPTPRTLPTDIGVGFVVVATEKGPLYGKATSFGHFIDQAVGHDGRTAAYAIAYDGAEKFFDEGGSVLHWSRHVGAAPVKASKTFNDADGDPTMKIEAANYGAFYNGWEPAIEVDGATFRIAVTDGADNDTEVLVSPDFDTVAEAVAWATTTGPDRGPRTDINVVDIPTGTGNPVAAAAAPLAGGTDDVANTSDATRQAALARFPRSLGPGQVGVWGDTTPQAILDLQAHGRANNRVPVFEYPDVASQAALEANAAAGRGGAYAGRELGLWPWVSVGGLLAGQLRKVPPSAMAMGRIAANDANGLPPNQPAAADLGQLQTAVSLTQQVPTDEPTLDELAAAGINVIKALPTASGGRVIQVYDALTLADPATHPQRVDFGTARLVMWITANAENIGLRYVQKLVDGKGLAISEFQGRLQAMLKPLWEQGALFGASPAEAYRVDTGPSVNTPQTIAQKKLRAQIHVRPSVPGREVEIGLITVPITVSL